MHIVPLAPNHAPDAARLHIEGQPGTFLSALGPEVLTALYRVLPSMRTGVGVAAVDDDGNLLGFISATTSVSKFFIEIGTRQLVPLLPPLMKQLVRHPGLIFHTLQTATYPFLVHTKEDDPPPIEMLSIMVESGHRNEGIGGKMVAALADVCRERGVNELVLTVDSKNVGAQRFYKRYGFAHHHDFTLYGRRMSHYRMPLYK